MERNPLLRLRQRRVSRPVELHHRPLAEPSGNSRLTRLPSGKRAGHTDLPVNEEIRSLRDKPLKKIARTDLVVLKAFELSYHPGQYRLIDVSEHGVQRRWGISPVVLDPAPEEWIELPAQSRLAATSEPLFRRSDPLRHQSRWFPSQRTPAGEQAPANVRLVRKRSSVTPSSFSPPTLPSSVLTSASSPQRSSASEQRISSGQP